MKHLARMKTRSIAQLGLLLTVLPVGLAQAQPYPYQDKSKPLETRLDDLMGRLTLDEKILLLGGTGFTTQPIARIGLPAMVMADAGQGVRGGPDSTLGPATAFPAGVNMASTWNPALVGQLAAAIGIEAQNKGTGVQVMLGPAVNIHRSPLGGRNGEYLSEDPYLAGRMAVDYIKGMQATGTVACIKHFAANNQETDRFGINAIISERALREIYLPAFEAGVKEGGVWTVMSSYNRLNGPHASASHYLLTDVLKNGWGFDGMVMSDWGGVHAIDRTIEAGNDLEMPNGEFLSPEHVKTGLQRGTIKPEQIEQNVRRTLRTVLRSGVVDGVKAPNGALVNSQAHRDVALKAAQESLILLKNQNNALPLDAGKIRSIALIGPAVERWQVGAGGSPSVTPLREVGPLEGIRTRVGAGVTIRTSSGGDTGSEIPVALLSAPQGGGSGFRAEYFSNKNLEGTPALTRLDPKIDFDRAPTSVSSNNSNWSARWTTTLTPTKSGLTTFALRADDGSRLFIDGKPLIDNWKDTGATTLRAQANLVAGQKYEIRIEYYQGGGGQEVKYGWAQPGAGAYDEAVEAARQSDVAIVVVTTRGTEGEGGDRPSFNLPNDQNELIRQVAAVNKKTIVVLNNGTPVAMPWLNSVSGLVETWFPGQEGGTALAQVLFGDVNPSGHLPTTLGARREDYPDYGNFPGNGKEVRYEEGIYVGYRGFDKKNIAPLFPFGYGLSYTNFRIDNLKLSSPTLAANGTLSATVRVTNTGRRAGAQVVQLYVRDPNPKTDKAVRELKGFAKVMLQPGQSQTVTLPLKMRDFAWCDTNARGWRVDAGNYEIGVGDSSRDLKLKATVNVAPWFDAIPFMVDTAALQQAVIGPDLAKGKPATASSLQEAQYKAEYAVDGDTSTRWASGFKDDQWLAVDLGTKQRIGRVHLAWEGAYALGYRIEVSDDNQNWKTVYSTEQGKGDTEDINFAPVETRYVRIFTTKRATEFGSSLWSFEVRAPAML
ncbi:beta-glucosidase [bacterium]|nr:MAG: beta-glucosidase [bacterium]